MTWLRWQVGLSGSYIHETLEKMLQSFGKEVRKRTDYYTLLQNILFAVAQARVESEVHHVRCVVAFIAHPSHYTRKEGEPDMPGHAIVDSTLRYLEKEGLVTIARSRVNGRASYFEPTDRFPCNIALTPVVISNEGAVQIYTAKEKEKVGKVPNGKTPRGKDSYRTVYRDVGHKPVSDAERTRAQNRVVNRVQAELTSINNHLVGFAYSFCDKNDTWYDEFRGNVLYHAVYNNSSTDQGGRNYCSIQNRPQRKTARPIRETMLIDGKATVECDYSNLHIRMLYHEKDESFDGDVYAAVTVPGWDAAPETQRSLFKTLTLALPNCGSPDATPDQNLAKAHAMAQSQYRDWLWETVRPSKNVSYLRKLPNRELPAGVTAADVLDAIIAAHPLIADQLYTGAGTGLQAIDGQIARNIMLRFVALGRPCVGIHDSFFVWAEDEQLLRRAMTEEYQKAMRDMTPVVETKQKKRVVPPMSELKKAA